MCFKESKAEQILIYVLIKNVGYIQVKFPQEPSFNSQYSSQETEHRIFQIAIIIFKNLEKNNFWTPSDSGWNIYPVCILIKVDLNHHQCNGYRQGQRAKYFHAADWSL